MDLFAHGVNIKADVLTFDFYPNLSGALDESFYHKCNLEGNYAKAKKAIETTNSHFAAEHETLVTRLQEIVTLPGGGRTKDCNSWRSAQDWRKTNAFTLRRGLAYSISDALFMFFLDFRLTR